MFRTEARVGSRTSVGSRGASAKLLDGLDVLHGHREVVLDSSAVLAAATLFMRLLPSIVRSGVVEYLVCVIMIGLVVSAFDHKDHKLAFGEGVDDLGAVIIGSHDHFFGARVRSDLRHCFDELSDDIFEGKWEWFECRISDVHPLL